MQIYTPPSPLVQATLQFRGGVRRLKEDVSVHTHIEPIADRNVDGWLNAQILARDFRTELPELLANRAGRRLTNRGRREQRCVLSLRQIDPRCEYAREQGKTDQSFVVIIYLVVKPSHALNVLANHSIKIDRAAIGVNDPRPDDLQAVLSVSDLGIVDSNHPRSLGNQEIFSRRRVVDVRADQSLYLAGEIGINSLLENGRHVPAHFHLVSPKRRSARGFEIIIDGASACLFDENLLAVLFVLQVVVTARLCPRTHRNHRRSIRASRCFSTPKERSERP